MVAPSLTSVVGIASSVVIATMTFYARYQFRGRMLPEAPPSKTVLAVGARPEDLEFGCGAALLHYRDQGYETHAVVLNCQERSAASTDADVQEHAEATRIAQRMKLSSLLVLDCAAANAGSQQQQIRRAIEDAVTVNQPEAVLTQNRFDHRLVFNATMEACGHVPVLLCYENPHTPRAFRPNFFVDASLYLQDKIEALKSYTGREADPDARPALARSVARMRGLQGKLPFAEAFEAIRVAPDAGQSWRSRVAMQT